MKKQSIEKWCEELGVRILDADGFERADFERELTEEEFAQGIATCTIHFSAEFREWFESREERGA